MAIRYSGDTELRLMYDEPSGSYIGTLSWRGGRQKMKIEAGTLRGITRKHRASPDSYDEAARAFFAVAWRRNKRLPVAWENGRILIRRTFQAPCPILE